MINEISYCKILDLPPLPDVLVQQALSVITDHSNSYQIGAGTPHLTDARGVDIQGSTYNRYFVSQEIFDWIVTNIPVRLPNDRKNRRIGIQVFRPAGNGKVYDPHTDGARGQYVLNYLIDAGGSNVLTKWYQQNQQPLVRGPGVTLKTFQNLNEMHSEHIQPGTWSFLHTRVLHSIVNIESPRIALSIGLNELL